MIITNKLDYKTAIDKLNRWTLYYDLGQPEVSDKEWDDLYFAIEEFEKNTGIIFDNSPTQKIDYQVVNSLQKVTHNHPMMSLAKTKDINELNHKFVNKSWIAMAKMDGLTCSLWYKQGKLFRAETRGNGEVGEDITHNALVIKSIPNTISIIDKDVIVDGEVICTYQHFEKFSHTYKNPRNFASGSIRLLDSKECAKRDLTFVAWDGIQGIPGDTLSEKLYQLDQLGFITVIHGEDSVDSFDGDFDYAIEKIQEACRYWGFPIDGIVVKLNECDKYAAAGMTSHHPEGALAYKFYDEEYETTLIDIDWSMGRTGELTPVARFNEIDINGTTVSKASLHNINILHNTLHGNGWAGQKIQVFKANEIIPQIGWAEEPNSEIEEFHIPTQCPICGGETTIRNYEGTETLICTNPNCPGKFVNMLDHIYGIKGLDIKGISKLTYQKLIDWGWIRWIPDVLILKEHKLEWSKKPGFGIKSVTKILNSIEEHTKDVPLWRIISAASIPQIGVTASKQLAKRFGDWKSFRAAAADHFDFTSLPDFGEVMDYEIHHFDFSTIDAIVEKISIESTEQKNNKIDSSSLKDKIFVITGKIHSGNRNQLKDKIEILGGKVTGSVSSKTNYLVNNDINSTSAKNQTAKKLNIPIITEEELLEMMGETK